MTSKAFSLNELIDQLPAGLDRTVLRILSFHVGKDNAVSRPEMLNTVRASGFSTVKDLDRKVRLVINELRKDGYLICSSGGEDGGYWIAADWKELQKFIEKELHSRAVDLLEQESALKQKAEQTWGAPNLQGSLGI